MFQYVSDIINDNQGFIAGVVFFMLIAIFAYAIYRGDKKNLEDFYRRNPKYDPRNSRHVQH